MRDVLAARDVVVAELDRPRRRSARSRRSPRRPPSDACARGSAREDRRDDPQLHGRRLSASLAGEQSAVGDDVLLHLGRAGADRRVALEAVEPRPVAAVDGVGTTRGEQSGRAEEVDRELGERLGEVTPLQLRERDLGPVLLSLDDLRERAVVEELGELDVGVRTRDALADLGIVERVGVDGARRRRSSLADRRPS